MSVADHLRRCSRICSVAGFQTSDNNILSSGILL